MIDILRLDKSILIIHANLKKINVKDLSNKKH